MVERGKVRLGHRYASLLKKVAVSGERVTNANKKFLALAGWLTVHYFFNVRYMNLTDLDFLAFPFSWPELI